MSTGRDCDWTSKQLEICRRFGATAVQAPQDAKAGIARNVKTGLQPVNGMRVPVVGDTTGWYIWAGGECSGSPDFFVPVHVRHLPEWSAAVVPYLQLPPGWRFLLAPDHEDVWFDDRLLVVPDVLKRP